MRWIAFLLLVTVCEASEQRVKALYNSLDPQSVSKHLALYQLYPDSEEGKRALQHAWELMGGSKSLDHLPDSSSAINALISLVNKQPNEEIPQIDEKDLEIIEKMASHLPNRKLKGYHAKTEEEVLKLPPEEVDLAKGLLLSDPEGKVQMRSYEAMIDLMALQILVRLSPDASSIEKIRTINTYVFEELGFRFPPHSLYAKDVDLYTFLPSVLDSRKGVCLGVSILYLCLAQRLNLSLETITPPGHIYVRYHDGETIINIETTARGIDTESELYLGIETRSLQQRNIKDVIGLAHINQASVYWQKEEHQKALQSYRTAYKYLPDDMLLKEFMGLNALFVGNKEEGETLLKEVKDHLPDYAIVKETITDDYLKGSVDCESIRPLFMHVDENRASILKKRDSLAQVVEKHPKFRAGLFALATTWLQLHRQDEALKILEKLHEIDPNNPTAEYYLTVLYMERLDYNNAWKHLQLVEKLVQARDHNPKTLKELRQHLKNLYPM